MPVPHFHFHLPASLKNQPPVPLRGPRSLSLSTRYSLYVAETPTVACTGGSCGGSLTGFGGTLTSTYMYDLPLIFLIIQSLTGSDIIHFLHTVVLEYGELLAYWFI
jgi:hypothetical protein